MLALLLLACAPPDPVVRDGPGFIEVETDALVARINRKGYVSGVAAGSLLDKKTGARDLGFGVHIMDFLLAPGWRDDGYLRDKRYHGDLPKHYVEGPQICTQAKELTPEVTEGKGFVAVTLRFTFTQPAKGLKAGSTWEQTLVFRNGQRHVESAERITSVNAVADLFYRIDMPGHIKHKGGDNFSRVYLSHLGRPIDAREFDRDFAPDAKFLYRRDDRKVPERMIRAYQVKVAGKPGPWLAGMTLDPAATSEAWCHQRGYVCFIQELHRRDVKAGDGFGAAYLVGWFDDVASMHEAYDAHKGVSRIVLGKDGPRLK
ncbi:MAG: hypothetical protein ACRC33_25405 [Gemmataceae bacterium]